MAENFDFTQLDPEAAKAVEQGEVPEPKVSSPVKGEEAKEVEGKVSTIEPVAQPQSAYVLFIKDLR